MRWEEEIFRVRVYARAYMNADQPDFKAAIQTLTLANERNAEASSIVSFGDAYGDKKSKCSLLSLS
jgi:hypothetical protein